MGASVTNAMDDRGDSEVLLDLLSEVEGDNDHTQRSLALRLGVALGLTNAYLKRCILKGWIKAQEAPKRRYIYYLTPTGFAEKSRLAAQYLSDSFAFFRAARDSVHREMRSCRNQGLKTIALYGDGELAQIAAVVAVELEITIAGIVAPGSNQSSSAGLPVVQTVAALGEIDAYILTDIKRSQRSYDLLCQDVGAERIFVPSVLYVTPEASEDGRDDDIKKATAR